MRVTKYVCGLALSSWKMTPLRVASSGRFSLISLSNFISWRQWTFELIVWFLGSSSKLTIFSKSHQALSIIFFWLILAFDVDCAGSSRLLHDLLCTTLSQTTHFSSPVNVRLKNWSVALRFSSEAQMEIRLVSWISFN